MIILYNINVDDYNNNHDNCDINNDT